MQTPSTTLDIPRYAKTIEVSKRIRWDIDRDVIRGRRFDLAHTFLPDGLSLADELPFLSPAERRFLSQVQGRTYANMFGLVERFIAAKIVDVGRDHVLDDQVAFEPGRIDDPNDHRGGIERETSDPRLSRGDVRPIAAINRIDQAKQR